MEKNNKCINLDTDDEIIHQNENRNRPPCRVIDLENEDEDEIVCIGVVDSCNDADTGNTSQGTPRKNQENIRIIDLECENDQLDVIDVESEIDEELEDINYTLRIEDSLREHDVIDVEDENTNNEEIRVAESMDCQHIESENKQCPSNIHTFEAIVHSEPDEAECSIDDYDARMREHFRLELDAFNDEPSTDQVEQSKTNDITHESIIQSATEEANQSICDNIDANQSVISESLNLIAKNYVNQSTQSCDNELECYNDIEDIIEINDDDGSGDDCVITSPQFYDVESSFKSNDSFTTLAKINAEPEEDKTPKRKKITETPAEIFRRMMPSSVPGVVSLFAPERHCLPDNIRPLKFCYYYFITSHLVVKEIPKNEFYKMKDQMLVAKKVIHPCTCLSHPLNKNASRITLLTNPQSLYHRSHCYFSQNSKKGKTPSPKRRGPRRLTYQVSFHRIPYKAEGKDFKDWNDVVIRRRQNTSAKPSWSCLAVEKENKIKSPECKSEPDSWDDMLKIEPDNEPIAIKAKS